MPLRLLLRAGRHGSGRDLRQRTRTQFLASTLHASKRNALQNANNSLSEALIHPHFLSFAGALPAPYDLRWRNTSKVCGMRHNVQTKAKIIRFRCTKPNYPIAQREALLLGQLFYHISGVHPWHPPPYVSVQLPLFADSLASSTSASMAHQLTIDACVESSGREGLEVDRSRIALQHELSDC
eukprot:6201280-Pleurochrysis_carterae.AAC.4